MSHVCCYIRKITFKCMWFSSSEYYTVDDTLSKMPCHRQKHVSGGAVEHVGFVAT